MTLAFWTHLVYPNCLLFFKVPTYWSSFLFIWGHCARKKTGSQQLLKSMCLHLTPKLLDRSCSLPYVLFSLFPSQLRPLPKRSQPNSVPTNVQWLKLDICGSMCFPIGVVQQPKDSKMPSRCLLSLTNNSIRIFEPSEKIVNIYLVLQLQLPLHLYGLNLSLSSLLSPLSLLSSLFSLSSLSSLLCVKGTIGSVGLCVHLPVESHKGWIWLAHGRRWPFQTWTLYLCFS